MENSFVDVILFISFLVHFFYYGDIFVPKGDFGNEGARNVFKYNGVFMNERSSVFLNR